MENYPVSTIQTIQTQFIDENNQQTTGGTVVVDLYNPTGAAVFTNAACIEQGLGYYYYVMASADIATTGVYRCVWSLTKEGVTVEKETHFSVGYGSNDYPTLMELRWTIARHIKDVILGQADSGTVESVNDRFLSMYPENLRGSTFYIYGGTNKFEKERKIITHEGTTLTVTPVYTNSIDTTSLFEIHKLFGVEDYNTAIRMAIESLYPATLISMSDESLTVPSNNTGLISIPMGFTHITGIFVEYYTGWPQQLPNTCWHPLPGRKQILLAKHIVDRFPGLTIRIEGFGRPAIPQGDTQEVTAPLEYVVKKSLANLMNMRIGGPTTDFDAHGQRKQLYEQEAVIARSIYRTYIPPNTKRVD